MSTRIASGVWVPPAEAKVNMLTSVALDELIRDNRITTVTSQKVRDLREEDEKLEKEIAQLSLEKDEVKKYVEAKGVLITTAEDCAKQMRDTTKAMWQMQERMEAEQTSFSDDRAHLEDQADEEKKRRHAVEKELGEARKAFLGMRDELANVQEELNMQKEAGRVARKEHKEVLVVSDTLNKEYEDQLAWDEEQMEKLRQALARAKLARR